MKTVTFLIIFLGCYALYNSSEKAYLPYAISLQKWLHSNKFYTKISGLIFILVGLSLSITFFGLSAGIITWLVATSLFLSLIILIVPLRVINYIFLSVLFTLTFIIEYFL